MDDFLTAKTLWMAWFKSIYTIYVDSISYGYVLFTRILNNCWLVQQAYIKLTGLERETDKMESLGSSISHSGLQ